MHANQASLRARLLGQTYIQTKVMHAMHAMLLLCTQTAVMTPSGSRLSLPVTLLTHAEVLTES